MTGEARTREERIQWAIDVEEIKAVLAKYCHGIDKQDEETFLSIWAEDADYVLPRGEGHGIDGVRALVRKVWEQVPRCHHHITNAVIEVDGDTAAAKTDVFYFRLTDDGVAQLLSGGYELEFVRRDGEWKTRRMEFSPFVSTSPVFAGNPA
ncbi:nuclear transport factor 2 family protein [Amycolatopsis dendrobii]|uniref:Nuclear transport factor 2 family protein n=1 Tax=Amycolatopsis dendrobii TaxID=2760662 RepID=A0A7W3VRW0_9PSEU|nr:nuclear transport factor 2 family protein [Amycolatopsis dendrobii]MBB1152064.1 nuclear transport factor 2 family protein [Amycolatopsis dendrobii]